MLLHQPIPISFATNDDMSARSGVDEHTLAVSCSRGTHALFSKVSYSTSALRSDDTIRV